MMMKKNDVILNALDEDLFPDNDITTDCLIDKNIKSTFELIVNENAVLAGMHFFKSVFDAFNVDIKVENKFFDGDSITAKTVIATLFGSTNFLLQGERTALNLVSHLSGIATLTRELIELIKHTNVILLDTRKTTPGLRKLERTAVLAGGAKNHRFNLSEMVLIKDNHIKIVGSVEKAIIQTRKCYGNKYKIEVEVSNLKELEEAINGSPDIIMFDNWNVSDLNNGLKLVPKNILTEVSGQINKENIVGYAESGINYISTSYMVKNSRWIDFSLDAR